MCFSYSVETVSDTFILIEAMFQIFIIINKKDFQKIFLTLTSGKG